MSEEVIKKLIEIEIKGDGEKSVKGLKKEIADLKDVILNLDKGTEEYDRAVERLVKDQRELNEVQALTKKTATALDGSYDALVHKMSLLKKEWRATNDEARRNELGQEIKEINDQLKEMDYSLGNHQRNVGNYTEGVVDGFRSIKEEIKSYKDQLYTLEEGTDEYNEVFAKLADATFRQRDLTEKLKYSTADIGEVIATTTGVVSGIASGFGAVQGAMALFGVENEKVEETMVKLQASLAMVQGLQGLEGIVDKIGGLKMVISGWIGSNDKASKSVKAVATAVNAETVATEAHTGAMVADTVATNGATVATNKFKKALIATGIGAVVVLIGTLIAYWEDLVGAFKKTDKALEDTKESMLEATKDMDTQMGNAVGNLVSEYEILRAEYRNLKTDAEKKTWIEENTEAFENLGLAVNDLNTAQEAFVTNSEKVINALKLQAEASALASVYQQAYSEAYTKKKELEDKKGSVSKGYEPTDDEASGAGLTTGVDYESYTYTVSSTYGSTGTNATISLDTVNEKGVEKLKEYYQEQMDSLDAEVAEILNDLINLRTEAASASKDAGLTSTGNGNKKEGGSKTPEEIEKEAEEARQAVLRAKQEEVKEFEELELHKLNVLKLTNAKGFEDTREYLDAEYQSQKSVLDKEMSLYEVGSKEYNALLRERTELDLKYANDVNALKEKQKEEEVKLQIEEREHKLAIEEIKYGDTKEWLDKEYQLQSEMLDLKLSLYDVDTEAYREVIRQKELLDAKYNKAKTEQVEEEKSAIDEANKKWLEGEKKGFMGLLSELFPAVGEGLVSIGEKSDNTAQEIAGAFDTAITNTGQLFGNLSELMKDENGEATETSKAFAKTEVIISTAMGVAQAIASAMQLGPIAGPIMGAINSAAVITSGLVALKNIENETMPQAVDGANAVTNSQSNLVQYVNNYETPYRYNRTDASDETNVNGLDTLKVVVLESDITETQNRQKARIKETSF